MMTDSISLIHEQIARSFEKILKLTSDIKNYSSWQVCKDHQDYQDWQECAARKDHLENVELLARMRAFRGTRT
jgi:hypothetical protein